MAYALLHEAGNEFFRKGELSKALDSYDRAIKKGGDAATLHCNRAACFLKLKRFLEALQEVTLCLRFDPGNRKARLRQAKALEGLKKFEPAICALEEATSLLYSSMVRGETLSTTDRTCLFSAIDDLEKMRPELAKKREMRVVKDLLYSRSSLQEEFLSLEMDARESYYDRLQETLRGRDDFEGRQLCVDLLRLLVKYEGFTCPRTVDLLEAVSDATQGVQGASSPPVVISLWEHVEEQSRSQGLARDSRLGLKISRLRWETLLKHPVRKWEGLVFLMDDVVIRQILLLGWEDEDTRSTCAVIRAALNDLGLPDYACVYSDALGDGSHLPERGVRTTVRRALVLRSTLAACPNEDFFRTFQQLWSTMLPFPPGTRLVAAGGAVSCEVTSYAGHGPASLLLEALERMDWPFPTGPYDAESFVRALLQMLHRDEECRSWIISEKYPPFRAEFSGPQGSSAAAPPSSSSSSSSSQSSSSSFAAGEVSLSHIMGLGGDLATVATLLMFSANLTGGAKGGGQPQGPSPSAPARAPAPAAAAAAVAASSGSRASTEEEEEEEEEARCDLLDFCRWSAALPALLEIDCCEIAVSSGEDLRCRMRWSVGPDDPRTLRCTHLVAHACDQWGLRGRPEKGRDLRARAVRAVMSRGSDYDDMVHTGTALLSFCAHALDLLRMGRPIDGLRVLQYALKMIARRGECSRWVGRMAVVERCKLLTLYLSFCVSHELYKNAVRQGEESTVEAIREAQWLLIDTALPLARSFVQLPRELDDEKALVEGRMVFMLVLGPTLENSERSARAKEYFRQCSRRMSKRLSALARRGRSEASLLTHALTVAFSDGPEAERAFTVLCEHSWSKAVGEIW